MDKCKMLCGLLFVIIIVILIIAIVRKGKLWGKEYYQAATFKVGVVFSPEQQAKMKEYAEKLAAERKAKEDAEKAAPAKCTTEKIKKQCFHAQGSANCKKICETSDVITCDKPPYKTVKDTGRSEEIVSWSNCI